MMDELQVISHKVDFAKPYFSSLLCGGHVNLYISTLKFEELEDLIRFANRSLRDGIKENHNATINGVINSTAQNVLRFYHLKYAILNYNACYDYILQIIYFAFDFCGEITNAEDYQEKLEHCTFGYISRFRKTFKIFSETNQDANALFSRFQNFYDVKRKQLSSWANAIKHRGNFTIPEMRPNRINTCLFSKGSIVFTPEIVYPNTATVEEIIIELKKQNKEICEFAEYLFDFIGFQKLNSNKLSVKDWFIDVRPFVYIEK